ncbi:hypothetical protein PJL18_04424 [Paenarthrobacter nicotinovorans]|nr:hypothetical protein [Paenarthrobacter nicotinovorans]
MDEEVRADVMHGLVTAHAADLLVDAPALAGGIAGPDEGLGGRRRPAASAAARRAAVVGFLVSWGRAESALPGFAHAVLILKVQLQPEPGARRQSLGVDFRGEVTGFRGQGSTNGSAEAVASTQELPGVVDGVEGGGETSGS